MKLKQFIFASMAMLWSFVSPVLAEDVAKIGDTSYATLEAAFAAATEGQTITMINDVQLTGMVTIPEGKELTLDLNGKAITVPETDGKDIYVLNNKGVLTIEDTKGNGSISARGIYNGYNGSDSNETVAGAKLTIKGGKFVAWDSDGGASIFNCAELIISGGTFEGIVAAINNRAKGVATLNGGTFVGGYADGKSTNYLIQNNGGSLTINNANVVSGFGAVGCYSGTTVINGGSFLPTGWEGKTCHVVYVAGAANVTINGGTFKMNYPANLVPDSGSAVASYYNGKLSITGGVFYAHFDHVSPVELSTGSEITGGSYYNHSGVASTHPFVTNFVKDDYKLGENGMVVAEYIAKIGDTPYTTLQAAVEAVQTGETIVLQDDITFTTGANGSTNGISYTRGASFTLDLNGKTITSNLGNNALRFKIGDGKSVTNAEVTVNIQNGKIVSGANNWCAISAATADNSDNKLIMNLSGLQIEANKAGDFAVKSWAGAVINTTNVDITANYAGGFYACGGEIVLDDASSVTQKGLYTEPYLSYAFGVSGGTGKMTINGGTYSTVPAAASDANNQGVSHGSSVGGVMSSGGTLIINGGTFSNDNFGDAAPTTPRALLMADAGAVVTINGGTFNAMAKIVDPTNNTGGVNKNAQVTIKGGTYSANPTDAPYNLVNLAGGYVALPDLSGNFVVGTQPTATVNNLGMTTVAAGEYAIWNGSFDSNTEDDGDMPLSFVMQFLADQDAEDMATSPYADWYGDFVLTFTGIEKDSFTADGCYLAGHYGSFGWVKVPVDGMTIEEGARYPVMLGVGLGQKYDYICSSVEDFKCALYLTPEILAANPNIQVKLELGLVDNSKGSDEATSALINSENVYSVTEYTYDAEDFVAKEELVIVDGQDFDNASDKHVDTFKYTRTFANSGVWNAMYLPVAIPMSAIDPDKYEIAYINDVHSEDLNGDGQININQDKMWMEVVKITNNAATLTAYGPYVIKAKTDEAKNFELTLENVTVKAAEEIIYDCSSMSHKFNIQGTCRKRTKDELAGGYVVSTKGGWVTSTSAMKPFRFYMTITDRWGNPVNVDASESQLMRIKVRGEEDTTEIDGVECNTNGVDQIFDLQGRRVATPVKGGIYIVNGKKVLFNK